MKIFWGRSEKKLLVVHLPFSHAKQLLMKPLIGYQKLFASPLVELILVNLKHTQFVNPCRWDLDPETKIHTSTKQTRSFEKMGMSFLQRQTPESKNESFYTTGRQKKTDSFSVAGF